MQSGLQEKARKLGRPLSSFRQRDMSLNEAQPSVLSQASGDADASGVGPKVIRTISAPRIVYSRFGDAEVTSDSRFSSGRTIPTSNSHAIGSVACTNHVLTPHTEVMDDSARPQKVQFQDSRNQVTMYTPSPTTSTSPTAAGFTSPAQKFLDIRARNESWSIEGQTRVQLAGHEEGVSRCASNLASRAGTFDEILESQGQKAHRSLISDFRASTAISLGVSSQKAGQNSNTVAATGSPDKDFPPSRCASNMSARAGTFDEIVADQVTAHPLSLVDSLLGDYSMLSNVSLTSQPPSQCPPTRRVSNMMSSAGTFNDVLDLTEDAVEKELFDGTISRRTTNMNTAAGAFEELVDDDGDELGPEQHSCSSLASDVDAEVTNLSLSGLVSADFLQASAAGGEHVPLISLCDDIQPSSQHSHTQGGCKSVAHFALPASVELVGANQELVLGMLPSDACPEVDESGGINPVATGSGAVAAHEFDARCDDFHREFGVGAQQIDVSWAPTQPQWQVTSQSPASCDLITFAGLNSQDRLSVVQEQIERLSVEEQKFLLSMLSARLNTVASPFVDTSSLATHLSIHTPHRSLTQFHLDKEAEGILSAPLVSSGMQLQKTMSSRGMTVKTPRAKYDVVFTDDENAELPSAMAALEGKHGEAAKAILTPVEWSVKIAQKPMTGSNVGSLGLQVPQQSGVHGKVPVHPASPWSADCATRLVAYRPDVHENSVRAVDH